MYNALQQGVAPRTPTNRNPVTDDPTGLSSAHVFNVFIIYYYNCYFLGFLFFCIVIEKLESVSELVTWRNGKILTDVGIF